MSSVFNFAHIQTWSNIQLDHVIGQLTKQALGRYIDGDRLEHVSDLNMLNEDIVLRDQSVEQLRQETEDYALKSLWSDQCLCAPKGNLSMARDVPLMPVGVVSSCLESSFYGDQQSLGSLLISQFPPPIGPVQASCWEKGEYSFFSPLHIKEIIPTTGGWSGVSHPAVNRAAGVKTVCLRRQNQNKYELSQGQLLMSETLGLKKALTHSLGRGERVWILTRPSGQQRIIAEGNCSRRKWRSKMAKQLQNCPGISKNEQLGKQWKQCLKNDVCHAIQEQAAKKAEKYYAEKFVSKYRERCRLKTKASDRIAQINASTRATLHAAVSTVRKEQIEKKKRAISIQRAAAVEKISEWYRRIQHQRTQGYTPEMRRSAICIQSWWRSLYTRRNLGCYGTGLTQNKDIVSLRQAQVLKQCVIPSTTTAVLQDMVGILHSVSVSQKRIYQHMVRSENGLNKQFLRWLDYRSQQKQKKLADMENSQWLDSSAILTKSILDQQELNNQAELEASHAQEHLSRTLRYK